MPSKFYDQIPAGSAAATPDALIRRLQSLENEVREMRAGRRLEASSIGRGGITVQGGAIILKDAAGQEIARMGARDDLIPAPDGSSQPGFILRRSDGSIAFTLDDPDPNDDVNGYRQLLKMHDATGNIIFMEDSTGGWGIASPTFNVPMFASQSANFPGTTSAAYEQLWEGWGDAWNPRILLGVLHTITGAASVGDIRILVNGVVQASAAPALNVVDTLNVNVDLRAVIGGAPGGSYKVTIDGRRTSGTGVVRAAPRWTLGNGTSGDF